jgi:hypothetical protein
MQDVRDGHETASSEDGAGEVAAAAAGTFAVMQNCATASAVAAAVAAAVRVLVRMCPPIKDAPPTGALKQEASLSAVGSETGFGRVGCLHAGDGHG